MLGIESDTKQDRRDSREDQKLQDRNLGDLRPQTDDERSGATDDQETADDLAPTNVALFHEGVEHF